MDGISGDPGLYRDTAESGESYDVELSTACFCSKGWHSRCAGSKNRKCRCKCKGRCHGIKKQPKITAFSMEVERLFGPEMPGPETLPEE